MQVGSNRRLLRCPTADCDQVLIRPRCSCNRRLNCSECRGAACLRCGESFHLGACNPEKDWRTNQRKKYLLVANCIKCEAPITKNGHCNHMVCPRCEAEFCWVCREKWQGHRWRKRPDQVSWILSCDELGGNTANSWLCTMLGQFLLIPYHAVCVTGNRSGSLMRSAFF